MGAPDLVWDVGAALGEGPVWSVRAQALWFVDIKGRRVLRLHPELGERREWAAPDQIGFVLPAAEGGLVAGLRTGLARFDPDRGTFDALVRVDEDRPGNRLNDATVDAAGAVWFGTMDDGGKRADGRLYRFDRAGLHDTRIPDTVIVNGPAFSPDGRWLYWVDTLGREVLRRPMDGRDPLGPSEVIIRIPVGDGYPDGPSVDAEGCLWIGMYGGWEARRYSPAGELLARVRFPVAAVTKLAFGGDDMRTVFATTARQSLDEGALARQPQAGGLFSFRVDVPGSSLPPASV